jgi:hypothetical protein
MLEIQLKETRMGFLWYYIFIILGNCNGKN